MVIDMKKVSEKRTVDMQIISDWVEPGSRVLDLGCGRGVMLEFLKQKKSVVGMGVDLESSKIRAGVKKGLTVYQGDIEAFMTSFPDGFFDRVLCSRTLPELSEPSKIIHEALRVGRHLTIGFVNHGYWKNRLGMLLKGGRFINEVYPNLWHDSRPSNPVSIKEFEYFCSSEGISISRKVYLRGDWKTPCRMTPNFLGGYALYDLSR